MTEARIQLPPKLVPVFQPPSIRYRGAYGGRGSGKTRTFAKMLAVRGYQFGKAGISGVLLCAREHLNSLADSSLEEVKAAIRSEPWLMEYYEIGEKYVRSKDGRIRFAFAGLWNNVDSIKSMARILIVWIDEAEPVSELSLTKLIPTVREEGEWPDGTPWKSEIWVTWNPESKRSAVHKRFRLAPPEDAAIVEINYRDNPWFPDVLEQERQDDLKNRPDQYPHVWEGDFASYVEGAYYADLIAQASAAGRIGKWGADPALPVHTAWDLGIGDSTAIWLWQGAPGGVRVVGYIEDHGRSLVDYVKRLDETGLTFGIDFVPHDARARELGTGRTRVETLYGLGRKPMLVPVHTVDDGINAVREIMPDCWFDESACEDGLEALRSYQSEFDDKGLTFKARPKHNWASHGADAFRYLAMGLREITRPKKEEKPKLPNGAIQLPPAPNMAPSGRRYGL